MSQEKHEFNISVIGAIERDKFCAALLSGCLKPKFGSLMSDYPLSTNRGVITLNVWHAVDTVPEFSDAVIIITNTASVGIKAMIKRIEKDRPNIVIQTAYALIAPGFKNMDEMSNHTRISQEYSHSLLTCECNIAEVENVLLKVVRELHDDGCIMLNDGHIASASAVNTPTTSVNDRISIADISRKIANGEFKIDFARREIVIVF